jgi:hypothetical protein
MFRRRCASVFMSGTNRTERIGNQIDATMIFARADFVIVHRRHLCGSF